LWAWARGWLDPLASTELGHPKWEMIARETGQYIGVVIVLVLGAFAVAKLGSRVVFFIAAAICFLLFMINLGLNQLNVGLREEDVVLFWRDRVWRYAYMLLCASILSAVAAIPFLIPPESQPSDKDSTGVSG
jgi:hypothetical protein